MSRILNCGNSIAAQLGGSAGGRLTTMSFEQELASLNQAYFFREFTFSNTTFCGQDGELELADSVLWIGSDMIIYQLKERKIQDNTSSGEEVDWFNRKVVRKGTRQIRDTLSYIKTYNEISIKNHRGHDFIIAVNKISRIQKLIVFMPSVELPDCFRKIKFHQSKKVGTIHLISAEDYKGIIQTLLTPAEFIDYLLHRESLVRLWGLGLNSLPEQALVGHYIESSTFERPTIRHASHLRNIEHEIEEWDISSIIRHFKDKIIDTENENDYYKIIEILASVKQNELKEFKKRFILSMEKARENKFDIPYRIAFPRIDSGFVFIPLEQEMITYRRCAIKNLTHAHKYDCKLSRCVGITFAADGEAHYTIDWCFIAYPWEYDQEMEALLSENNPSREVRVINSARYTLKDHSS